MSSHPPRRLYCLRHFHAARPVPGQRDVDRPLDAKGLAQAGRIDGWIRRNELVFSTVLSSPSRRTRETVRGIGLADDDRRIVWLPQLYEAEPSVYFDCLAGGAFGDGTLLVGHNPGMEEFLVALCGPDIPLPLQAGLGTGALAVVTVPGDGLRHGSGVLEELISPSAL